MIAVGEVFSMLPTGRARRSTAAIARSRRLPISRCDAYDGHFYIFAFGLFSLIGKMVIHAANLIASMAQQYGDALPPPGTAARAMGERSISPAIGIRRIPRHAVTAGRRRTRYTEEISAFAHNTLTPARSAHGRWLAAKVRARHYRRTLRRNFCDYGGAQVAAEALSHSEVGFSDAR